MNQIFAGCALEMNLATCVSTGIIDPLYRLRLRSPPLVTLTETRLLALFSSVFIIVQEIFTFCALTRCKVIITIIKA